MEKWKSLISTHFLLDLNQLQGLLPLLFLCKGRWILHSFLSCTWTNLKNKSVSFCIPFLHIFGTASNLLPHVNNHLFETMYVNATVNCGCLLSFCFDYSTVNYNLVYSRVALFTWHWQTQFFHAGTALPCSAYSKFNTIQMWKGKLVWQLWCFFLISIETPVFYIRTLNGFNLYTCSFWWINGEAYNVTVAL